MSRPLPIPRLGDNGRTCSSNTFSIKTIGIVTFIAVLSSFLESVLAAPSAPQLVYPLQAQRPPVARVGEAYSWTLLPGTFNTSSGSTLTLTSRSLPYWIDFDSASATFSGNPRTRDVGSRAVTVVANVTGVATGATDAFTLLVVTDPGPDVFLPFSKQLPSAAYAGGGASLLPDGTLKVPPSWSFSLGFQQYTFQDQTNQYAQIYYTSYAARTTQLPSWLRFDNRTVTFDGVAPSTPGEYSIVTYGSNYFGYGDVQQMFVLRVGTHILTMTEDLAPIRTTPSSTVAYQLEFDGLRIDNASVTAANLTAINVNLANTSFLTYDSSTQTISGIVPSNFKAPQNFTIPITLTDQNNDTLATNLSVAIYASLFSNSTPSSIQIVAGQTFSQNLSSFAASRTATYSAVISPQSAQEWAQFDAKTLTLSGTAPTTVQNVSVAFTAVEKTLNLTSQDTLILAVVSSSSTSKTSATAAAATGAHVGSTSTSGLSRAARLSLGLGLGLGLGLLLLTFIAACLWRRKNKKRPYSDLYRRSFGAATPTTFKSARTARSSTIVGSMFEGRTSFEKRQDEKVGPQYEEQQRVWAAPVVLPGGMEELSPRTIQSATSTPGGGGGFAAAAAVVKSSSSNVLKRFDLMGIFRSATGMIRPSPSQPMTDKANISLPIGSLQNSLRGLGLGASSSSLAMDGDGRRNYTARPTGHDIVDMRHHDVFAAPAGAGRHVDDSESNPSDASRNLGLSSDLSAQSKDESHLERSSTWASGASSSLFYSDSDRDSRHQRSGQGRTNKPRVSVPQQRKDFQPLVINAPPLRTSSAVHAANDSSSSMGSSSPSQERHLYGSSDESQSTSATGIRLVTSHTNSSGNSAFPSSCSGSSGHPVPRDATDASLGDASFASSQHLPPPQVRPFTQERRVSSSSQAGSSYSSQTALRGTAVNRNSAIEDADESALVYTTAGGTRMSARPVSAVYEPPSNDSRTISAVIYPYLDERDSMATHQGRPSITPSTYSEYTERGRVDSVRLIPGTVANSPFALSPTTPGAGSSWRYPSSLSGTSTIYSVSTSRPNLGEFDEHGVPPVPAADPIRVQVNINEPFRFHIPLPLQHSSSSTEFEAYLDLPGNTNGNRQSLPGWITFDESGTKEVSGCARRADAGILPILIIERSQPKDSRYSDELVEEQERVVARYEIEVAEREPHSLTYPEGEEPQGELRIIS
ncbi:BQ2448_4017 [Microbotryum intermedium]|uniref:BQ2448_4017 protein n=1 Tax=Microbotryum intermedium TaxID=269621 RepID=A0A238FFA1_9BASI|nr:BQ2448_4017 [Microbotryum intermedium]